jgi:L-lactate dehydrogenase complex protein LldG
MSAGRQAQHVAATTARDRMLERIRTANADRSAIAHPGDFGGWRTGPSGGDPMDGFVAMFTAAGGEVVRVADENDAVTWLDAFALEFASISLGVGVPPGAARDRPRDTPDRASLGVSRGRAAIAETGSLVLDARDGRRAQLLVPVHVVLIRERDVHATAREAFLHMAPDLPAALGLHSGPSKSADIGQVMVKGVHGPGRVIAVLIQD